MVDFPAPIIPSIRIRCLPTRRAYDAVRLRPLARGFTERRGR